MFRCVLVSLALATFAYGQNPPGYLTAFRAAKERGCVLVIFHQCEGREIAGVETLECSRFPDTHEPQIIVGNPETLKCHRLYPNATDAEILACFPKKSQVISRGKFREYTRDGKTYREYFSEPEAAQAPVAKPVVSQPVSVPYTFSYPAIPVNSPVYSSGVYGGFNVGGFGGYGGFGADCYGGR